ncbi:MAG: zeta toxin family protein, partial [Candidatus Thalassarchaeaceae archaeon]|nr:zeta toxin family protein [Candidatus Thalassarchaeaceae archaeon]
MGFFDRFRKRIKKVADDTDIESLTAEEDSEEALAALAKREESELQRNKEIETPVEPISSEEDWDDISDMDLVAYDEDEEDDWDDLDDDPIPEPISPTLDKKERKKLQQQEKLAKKEKKKLQKMGFDVNQETRPEGSRVDLHIMRSTTGRKLVEVESAPRGSSGPSTIETSSGKELKIDLGGGVVESGGKIIKGGVALDSMLEELELVLLESDMSQTSIEEVIHALKNELVGSRLRKGADLSIVVEASLKRALLFILDVGYWDFDATVDSLIESGDTPVVIMMVGVNGTGKTTTTAKIAHCLKQKNRRVVLAAADTFRAGAIDQLESHAERLDIRCISSQRGGDAAAIARDAIEHAKARRMDVVIVDTAGRMQNKSNLMEEL